MEYEPGSYQALEIKQYPARSLRETAEGRYWRRFKTPSVVKQFGPVSHIDFCQVYPYNFAVTAATRVVVYNGHSRQVGRTFGRFKDTAYSGSFRSDGKLLVAGGQDGVVKVFDSGSRAMLRQLKAHKRPTHVARWSPDKLHVLSGSDDVTVRWWDVTAGEQVCRFEGHTDYVRSASVSPADACTWATGGYDHCVRLWDVRAPGAGAVLALDHGAPVEDLAFFPSGSLLVSAGGNSLCVWDLVGGGRLLHRLANFQKTVSCVRIAAAAVPSSSAAPRLLAGSLDGHVKVIEMDGFKVTHASLYPGPVTSLGISPDCATLVVGMADGSVNIRKHDQRRSLAAGLGNQPLRRQHYKPRLTAANFRYFIRGQSERAAASDHVVQSQRRVKLGTYDKLLKQFRHRDALTAALATQRPEVVASVVEECIARGCLPQALGGRDAVGLMPLLQFLVRHVANPRHSALCCIMAHWVLDAYAGVIGVSAEVDGRLEALRVRLAEEIKVGETRVGLRKLDGDPRGGGASAGGFIERLVIDLAGLFTVPIVELHVRVAMPCRASRNSWFCPQLEAVSQIDAMSSIPLARRILTELDGVYCPIGDTKAVSWLGPHPFAIDTSGHCRVLSLACGDPRNVLLTLGSLSPPSSSATATPDPTAKASSCSYLELHANDHNPSIIARNMVLLALAAEVDPASPTDMQLLFDVWYNLLWDEGSQVEARFKTTIQHILDGRYPWMQVPRPSDMRKVHEVLRWWLEDAGQSTPAHVLEVRQAAGGSAAGAGPWLHGKSSQLKPGLHGGCIVLAKLQPQPTINQRIGSLMKRMKKMPYHFIMRCGGRQGLRMVLAYNAQCALMDFKTKSSSVGEALRKDFLAWARLGSLRGQQEQQWSKSTAKTAAVNCTMLPPFKTPVSRWTAHYDQQFMRGWAPLELHELQAVARPDQLASALQAAATAARASPAVEDAPLPGPWGAFPPCPAPPVDKAGARPEYRPALLNQTYKAGMLARACMVRMAAACVAMQRNARLGGPGEVVPVPLPPAGHSRPGDSAGRSGVPAQMCFWLGDCLQLCQGPDLEQHWAHRPAAQPTVVGAPQQAQQGQPGPQPPVQPPLMFHVIDTSSVADHVGLLNVLLAAQPRLMPHPLACLITCSMTWKLCSKSMREYLRNCLNCSPSHFTTLFGLRLVTDITFGKPQPHTLAAQLWENRLDPRLLVWSKSVATVGSTALTQALMLGQQQSVAARQTPWKDPAPGHGLAGGGPSHASSLASGTRAGAMDVLVLAPSLALPHAGRSPPYRAVEGNHEHWFCCQPDTLENHLGKIAESCSLQGTLCTGLTYCSSMFLTSASLAHLLLSGCAAGRFSLFTPAQPTAQPLTQPSHLSYSPASGQPGLAAVQQVLRQSQELMRTLGSVTRDHWQLSWRAVQADLAGCCTAAMALHSSPPAAADLAKTKSPHLLRFTKDMPMLKGAQTLSRMSRGSPMLRALLLPISPRNAVSASSVPWKGVLDEQDPIPSDWDKHIMTWASPSQYDAPVPPAGVHILDSLAVNEVPGSNRCQWTLSLLLPADHGLNLGGTAVVVIDLQNRARVLQPTRLSSFKVEQVTHKPDLVTLLLQSAAAGWAAGPDWAVAGCGGQSAAGSEAAQCCAQCGTAGEELLKCGRCREVTYCSPACQKKHWKAHKASCHAPADAASQSTSTASQPAGTTSEQAGPVASKQGQAAASPYSWAVAEAIETSSSYSLILQLISSGTAVRADCEPGGLSAEVVRHWDWQSGSSSSSGGSSGPIAKGSQGKAPELLSLRLGVTTSHFIALRLERPAGVRPLLLQLPWPISSGANEPDGLPLGCYSGGQGLESVQLRRKSGQVWLKLRKAEEWERWPADAPPTLLAAPPQPRPAATPLPALLPTPDCIDIDCLRPLDASDRPRLLAYHLLAMINRENSLAILQEGTGDAAIDAELGLCEALMSWLTYASKGTRSLKVLVGQATRKPSVKEWEELYVLFQMPIKEGPNGIPVLPIIVRDQGVGECLITSERLRGIVHDPTFKAMCDITLCLGPSYVEDFQHAMTYRCTNAEELALLRRMIYRNALRCKPSAELSHTFPTRYNDPSSSPWFVSFISPRYTEHLGMELDWATLTKQLMKLDPSQPVTVVTPEVAAKKAAEIIALEAEARLHGGKAGQSRSIQQQQPQRSMPTAAAAPPIAPAKAQAAKSPGVQTAQPAGRQVAQEANKTAAQPGSGAPALAAVSKPCDTWPVSAAATAAAGGPVLQGQARPPGAAPAPSPTINLAGATPRNVVGSAAVEAPTAAVTASAGPTLLKACVHCLKAREEVEHGLLFCARCQRLSVH
ncbi:hypothetical protein QJQ45_020637 [Haematococcus lacustris]|nr:hypothetical protein QJQ45_020637 [Haematococcus lacustris]